MTFGWAGQTSSAVDQAVANDMMRLFVRYCDENSTVVSPPYHVDTARIYAGGKTEPMVGTAIREIESVKGSFLVGTKAHPSAKGGLSPEGMRAQLRESLDAMQLDSVSEYYLHQPDTENSLLDSLKCAHEMVTEGLVKTIGVSYEFLFHGRIAEIRSLIVFLCQLLDEQLPCLGGRESISTLQ
jgi:aflatoxin B1 aldehyde reductase